MRDEPSTPKASGPRRPLEDVTYNDNTLEDTTPALGKKTYHVGVVETPPRLIVDAHTHIQSNNVAPHPTVASMAPIIGTVFNMRRSYIERSGLIAGQIADFVTAKPVRGAIHKATGGKPNPDDEYYERWSLAKGVEVGQHPTDRIGADLVRRIDAIREEFRAKPPYDKASDLEWVNVIHPMDMEYCHVFGYYGLKVYNAVWDSEEDAKGAERDPYIDKAKATDKEPSQYWYPKHGKWQKRGNEYLPVDEEDTSIESSEKTQAEYEEAKTRMEKEGLKGQTFDDNGKPVSSVRVRCLACVTHSEETKLYERWLRQVERTERAVCEAQLKLLPMFHYDPRRWQSKGNGVPLSLVQGDNLYLGFKIYTAQGYRPYDVNRLPILKSFYAACESGQIPILNHCTPGGAITFDMKAYLDFKHRNDQVGGVEAKEQEEYIVTRTQTSRGPGGEPRTWEYEERRYKDYFQANFVSPQAWRKVLVHYPNLRLCLAHFGGIAKETLEWKWHDQIFEMMKEYPNLHVDISSSFCSEEFRDLFKNKLIPQNPGIHDRILFGSDWFMTLNRLTEGKDYKAFCDTAKACIESMENGKELWIKFTQENPYRFYRMGKRIGGIAKAIEMKLASETVSQGVREQPGPGAKPSQPAENPSKEEILKHKEETLKRAEFIRMLNMARTS